jgi:outer membrane lipoprotein
VIIGAKNVKDGTLIEVLQKPTDRPGRPKDVDLSNGRFMALYEGYLDVAIYSRGREVTTCGEVQGKEVLPLGEISYTYPLISIKETHLWRPERKERIFYPYPCWHYPWWYYPYCCPW